MGCAETESVVDNADKTARQNAFFNTFHASFSTPAKDETLSLSTWLHSGSWQMNSVLKLCNPANIFLDDDSWERTAINPKQFQRSTKEGSGEGLPKVFG
jgi:hypothetical protein